MELPCIMNSLMNFFWPLISLRVGHWKNGPPSSPYLCSKSIRFSHSFILRKLVSPTPHSKNLNFKPWLRIFDELDTAREASDSQDASVVSWWGGSIRWWHAPDEKMSEKTWKREIQNFTVWNIFAVCFAHYGGLVWIWGSSIPIGSHRKAIRLVKIKRHSL